ncbi:MAG: phage holin family protein [Burkholderiaceae bacterium]
MALAETLSRLSASLLRIVNQRFELATVDIEEELLRLGILLAGTLVTALILALALAAAAVTMVVYFWDSSRMAVLLAVTGLFTAIGLMMVWQLSHALRDKPRFMASTLAQLDHDRTASGGSFDIKA